MITRKVLATVLLASFSAVAGAQDSTFRISQVYSDLNGEVQFIELTESAGLNGQHHLAGLTLTVTSNGVVRRLVFSRDLPTDQTAHLSVVVGATYDDGDLPVTDGAEQWSYTPYASVPRRFIPTEGGTLDFAGVDRMTYGSLPSDGVSALYRDGEVRLASIPSDRSCPQCSPRVTVYPPLEVAVEYYHPELDRYFISASAADLDALDRGRHAGWERTSWQFPVLPGPHTDERFNQPVCRFYIPPGQGDSHFFSASAEECAAVRERFPEFVLENAAAFYVALPDPVTGECQDYEDVDGVPVYRLWNGRSDANHRYTTEAFIRREMLKLGWVSEGYGPLGVAMCFPEEWWY